MNAPEPLPGWAELRVAGARQLKPGFPARVVAGAAKRRHQARVQGRLMLATALACFLGLNLAHWISATRAHRANLAEWQEYLAQTETLQTAY